MRKNDDDSYFPKLKSRTKETLMILTKSQGERLTAVLHAARPGWDERGITRTLRDANQNEGLPAVDFDHALRAAIAYATEPGPNNGYAKITPAFLAQHGKHWTETMPPAMPAPKLPPCEDHDGQDAETCACCLADIKLGQRPAEMLGKRMTPITPLPTHQIAHHANTARQAIRQTTPPQPQNPAPDERKP